jgi:hypothetical protein
VCRQGELAAAGEPRVGQVAAAGERAGAVAAVRTSKGVGIRQAMDSGELTSARWSGQRRHARGPHGGAALRWQQKSSSSASARPRAGPEQLAAGVGTRCGAEAGRQVG